MAELARFLIEQRIAFTMEKPCGVTTAEVDDIARRARERIPQDVVLGERGRDTSRDHGGGARVIPRVALRDLDVRGRVGEW